MSGYDSDAWLERISGRTDITSRLVHLTRETEAPETIFQVLGSILREKKLRGSTTTSGFIVGPRPAVCLQEAPLVGVAQNLLHEQRLRARNAGTKVRYRPVGLTFRKSFVFRQGGRPVVYEKTELAKKWLPEDEWWRIVNMNLDDDSRIIDWSHEREWRVPDQLTFEWSDVGLLVGSGEAYRALVPLLNEVFPGLLQQINGIVTLGSLVR